MRKLGQKVAVANLELGGTSLSQWDVPVPNFNPNSKMMIIIKLYILLLLSIYWEVPVPVGTHVSWLERPCPSWNTRVLFWLGC